MIFGIGIDIIEIKRIEHAVLKNSKFLDRNFTVKELNYFASKKNNYESIAGYFAAKEAVSKALGTGFRSFNLIDIEILKNQSNQPYIILHDNARNFAEKNEVKQITISISHSKEYAVANAVATL